MLEWMKSHRAALIVASCMFAMMAMLIVEAALLGNGEILDILDTDKNQLCMWIWRIGGAVTWPVFMFLLLRPHMGKVGNDKSVLATICGAALVYGGFGLWLVSKVLNLLMSIPEDSVLTLLYPFVGILCIVLPYAYVWGFVALYGFGRQRLLGSTDSGWVKQSALAAVIGIYGIGALIYLALAVVMVPLMMVLVIPASVSVFPEHVFLDVCAAAISTGNFASQWWAFKRVDDYFLPQAVPVPVAPSSPYPLAQVSQPGIPVVPIGQQPTYAGTTLPKIVCTCGHELTIDQSRLPEFVAKEKFCPNCGARLAR